MNQLILEPLPLIPKFTVAPEAEQRRNELILAGEEFAVAKTNAEANSVGEASRDLRTYVASVKEQNLKWRRPVNDALARSIAIEKEHLAPAIAEMERLERIAGDFHAAERCRVAEEERKRREEIARLERERQEAERKAREEQNWIDHEKRDGANRAQAALDAAKNQKARNAVLKVEKQRQEALAARKKASDEATAKLQAAFEAAMRAPMPEVHKVAGVGTKRVMEFEVVDIKAVFAFHPELCEPLAIKKSAVRAVCVPKFLQASNEVDDTSVPGLRLFWRDDTTTRRWDR